MRPGALFGIATVAVATPLLASAQWLVLRTRIFGDGYAPRFWHGLICRALGIRVHVKGRLAEGRPLLIASNHVSWTDVMVLGSIAPVHFIARGDLAGWPVMGTLSKLARTVFIDRERRSAAPEQARQIADRLSSGDPMVLFAEGTCGDGNHLLPFKTTLFAAAQLALDAMPGDSVLIQPAAIVYKRLHGIPTGRRERAALAWIGDVDLLPHLRSVLAIGAIDVEVHLGEPVPFTAGSNRKEVARRVEAEVRAMAAAAIRGCEASTP